MAQEIITKKELKQVQAMEGVQIRLPKPFRDQARALARKQTETSKVKVTETDVYRTAIVRFLAEISTICRD